MKRPFLKFRVDSCTLYMLLAIAVMMAEGEYLYGLLFLSLILLVENV